MPGHDVIVIGGSAGGIEALSIILAELPVDLPAALCVAIHQAPLGLNRRAKILARVAALPVVLAEHGMQLQLGVVHLAVPDQHLYVEKAGGAELGRLRLERGLKEHHSRPAIDPLFRSAAVAFGRRVVGVVLSGALDDGTAGLSAIKARGGLAIVQDPDDALLSSMPAHAIEHVGAHHIVPASAIAPLLIELARTNVDDDSPAPAEDREPIEPRASSRRSSHLSRDVRM